MFFPANLLGLVLYKRNLTQQRQTFDRHSTILKSKGSLYSITERRVPELIPVLGTQPAGGASHKPGSRLPLLSARHAVTLATLKRDATNFAKTVARQRRDCDLNPGRSLPEYSTLTTRLPSHPSEI